ncbi:MAG TPA: asparagine synthase (glutamine-hydrolyzing) [Terriglobia bacterium]|nr:asparagine synthase (glutamine-hydrolyzing) [Terriglobia bacterium]
MCGICGIFNSALEPDPHLDIIREMSRKIEHRGPDSHGQFTLPFLALAIRRLSIIDLQTGNQPLNNEAGDVTLVFNGEIYNYRELRQQLVDRGHRFKTHSDGEVITHLYEEKGEDFVQELNGMFAIALWDDRAKRLILARDRAGEKPLFYWHRGHTLVFGSEIKALLEYPGISREIDTEALTQYFFYGYFPTPRTVYAGIRKLPAAHYMVVERDKFRVERYWQLRKFLRPPGLPPITRRKENELVEELRLRLREAAVSRLVSDVPLGVFLSGGVDSSTVVAAMSELSPGNVSTFSVAFPDKTFNEEAYSNLVAKHFSTQHHVLTADDRAMRDALRKLQAFLDEPVADPAVIPTYMLSRFSRQHIKVALSGEGSDELFGGYPTYLGARLAEYYLRVPGVIRREFFSRLTRFLPVSSTAVPKGLFLRRFLTHAERDPAERHHIWFGMFSPAELDQLFCSGWNGPVPASRGIFTPLARVLDGASFDETLAEMLYLDFRLYLEDNLLVKVDRASMACSLELRTPFLDHRLIEFAAGLPASLKVRRFQLKYILKRAVEKWLPHRIVYRQKRGFSVPIARWMRKELRPTLDRTLAEDKLKRQGLFEATFVRRLLQDHWAGHADNRKTLWTLFCFQLWYDRWIENRELDFDEA